MPAIASRRRINAPMSLWLCCAQSDGAGVALALRAGAQANDSLEGPLLELALRHAGRKAQRVDLSGISPLGLCARMGCLSGFEELLAAGASLEALNAAGMGISFLALSSRNQAMADKALSLIGSGALELQGGALAAAVAWGRKSAIGVLLSLGADPSGSSRLSAPIVHAFERCDAGAAKMLMGAGACIDERRCADGATPLMIASDLEHLGMMDLAIELGADLDALDVQGRCAVQRVALKRDASALKMLLDRGADPDMRCPKEMMTALGRAARSGSPWAMKVLLAAGASAAMVGMGRSVLAACQMGLREMDDYAQCFSMECLEIAIRSGVDIDAYTPDGDSTSAAHAKKEWPLLIALIDQSYDKKAAKLLLSAGASTEIRGEDGMTLLERWTVGCVERNGYGSSSEGVRVLLDHGALVTQRIRSFVDDEQSWRPSCKVALDWFERLKAARIRQGEIEELSKISAPKSSGSMRM